MSDETHGLCRSGNGAWLAHDLAPDGSCRRCKRQIVETRASRKAQNVTIEKTVHAQELTKLKI